MATSKSLKQAVKTETEEAAEKAKTGNAKTEEAPAKAPKEPVDLPTGTRRHLPPA